MGANLYFYVNFKKDECSFTDTSTGIKSISGAHLTTLPFVIAIFYAIIIFVLLIHMLGIYKFSQWFPYEFADMG